MIRERFMLERAYTANPANGRDNVPQADAGHNGQHRANLLDYRRRGTQGTLGSVFGHSVFM